MPIQVVTLKNLRDLMFLNRAMFQSGQGTFPFPYAEYPIQESVFPETPDYLPKCPIN